MPTFSKPATVYVWDSGGVHLVVPTSGHLSGGYINDEVPGSGETNALFQNWGLNLQYLLQKQGLIRRLVLNSGTGTYTPSANCDFVRVRGCGGGGNGGSPSWGSLAGGFFAMVGSGGNAGVFADFIIPTPTTGGTWVVGAQSSGAGNDSSIIINGHTITMRGGAQGTVTSSSSTSQDIQVGSPPAITINLLTDLLNPISAASGTIMGYGQDQGTPGCAQLTNTGPFSVAGQGGNGGGTPFGPGQPGSINASAFNTGFLGFGGGGGGASLVTISSGGSGGTWLGSNGMQGIIIVEEYANSL